MNSKKIIKLYFIELCEDLILLKIASFHKYIGSLVNKSPSAVKYNTKKEDKKRRGA